VWNGCIITQDRDQWQALVKTVMNLRFPFLTDRVTISRSTLLYGVSQRIGHY
jgi:hypothetical protein